MLKIAVCDDDPVHLKLADDLIRRSLEDRKIRFDISHFDHPDNLLEEMRQNEYRPDIAVLDIDFHGEKGITLAKKMNETVPFCQIIFLSGYVTYAPDVYETQHVWFVLKSTAEKYFPMAMEKALQPVIAQEVPSPSIIIRENGITTAVPVNEILYLSKVHRKAYIRCLDHEYFDTRRPALLIPEHLKDHFIQCHQGYWVNIDMIKELSHNVFILQNGIRIPISRTFSASAKKRFLDYYRGIS